MSQQFIQFAFSAGVLAPSFLYREDLEKFDLGLRRGENWIVDYRGGVYVRPPLEFAAYTKGTKSRLVPFQFNTNQANTYIIVMGDEFIRFMQDGVYVTEDEVTVTDVSDDNPAEFTASSHGYSNGDWIYLTVDRDNTNFNHLIGLPFIVANATTNTFSLQIPESLDDLDFSALPGGSSAISGVSRVYEISSPYADTDLDSLAFDQYRDEVRITSVNFYPRKLTRFSDANWTIAEVAFEGNTDAPDAPSVAITTVTPGGAVDNPDNADTDSGVLYAITAINSDGQESFFNDITLADDIIDITNNAGSLKIDWSPVVGAVKYNVYRSLIIPEGHEATFGMQLGYLGEAIGSSFVDNNIVPDFTRTPPVQDNPFADGAVQSITITAGGTSYDQTDTTISITGGSGFSGKVIVNNDGEVIGVRSLNPGSDYDGGVITFGGPTGSGASATLETSPASGNNPSCSVRSEQRQVYAGTTNLPMGVFFSQSGFPDSFDFSSLGQDTDAFDLSLDSPQLTPISNLMSATLGLLAFTESQVYHIRGIDGGELGVNSIKQDPVTEDGAEAVQPIKVEDHVLYVVSGSAGVNAIQPSQLRNFYQARDLSLFSSHFFTPTNKIIRWAYANIPDKHVWAIREDGSALCLTYVPDQNVYAWTDHTTRGKFKDVAVVREGDYDRVYFIVERLVDGVYRDYIERMDVRYEETRERIFAMDSYIEPVLTNAQTVELTLSARTGTITITAASSVFTGQAGNYIRVANGLLLITSVTSGTECEATVVYSPDKNAFQGEPLVYSNWTLDAPRTTIRGLWHLGSETVVAVSEGEEATIALSAGEAELGTSSSASYIGFNYTGDLVSLPLKLTGTYLQDKKKRISSISLRLRGAKRVQAGTLSVDDFYDLESSLYDDYALTEYIDSEIVDVAVGADWRDDDGIVIRKANPFRATVLGFMLAAETGLD